MPQTAPVDFGSIGKQYGKPDLERLGIFIEAPYLNGKGYVSPFGKPRYFRGRNMLGDGRKSKTGTQHGYFEEEFKRLFEGEPSKKKPEKKRPYFPFWPTGPGKWSATPGDYYGCFSGNIEAFSNKRVKKPRYRSQEANFTTNPVRQGGPGYADICLSKYPEHVPDPYKPIPKKKEKLAKNMGSPMITCHYPQDYFDNNPYLDPKGKIGPTYVRPKDKGRQPTKSIFYPTGPAKWPGGTHAGCFSPFPDWQPTPPKGRSGRRTQETIFVPPSLALKTMFTTSVMHAYTDFKVNAKNHNTYTANYTKHLLD